MTYALGLTSHKIDDNTRQLVEGCGSSFYLPIDGRLGDERVLEAALSLDNQWNRDRGIVGIQVYSGTLLDNHDHKWFTVPLLTNRIEGTTYNS